MNTLEITFKPMADGLDWELPDGLCVQPRSGQSSGTAHEAWRWWKSDLNRLIPA
jgi:hypothetical protein